MTDSASAPASRADLAKLLVRTLLELAESRAELCAQREVTRVAVSLIAEENQARDRALAQAHHLRNELRAKRGVVA